jgi:hypothetical protein
MTCPKDNQHLLKILVEKIIKTFPKQARTTMIGFVVHWK